MSKHENETSYPLRWRTRKKEKQVQAYWTALHFLYNWSPPSWFPGQRAENGVGADGNDAVQGLHLASLLKS